MKNRALRLARQNGKTPLAAAGLSGGGADDGKEREVALARRWGVGKDFRT